MLLLKTVYMYGYFDSDVSSIVCNGFGVFKRVRRTLDQEGEGDKR